MLENKFWQIEIFDNVLISYLAAIIAFVIFLIVFKIFQKIILTKLSKLAKKTKTNIDDAVMEIFQSIKPPFYLFLAFWLAMNFLKINDFVQKLINAFLTIFVIYQIIAALQIFIDYLAGKKSKDSKSAVDLIAKISKGVIWSFGVLMILSNLGVNVTSLIAGLGIGGVAVALALQNILSDLFSSFAIHFDKPFVVGDFIIVGQDLGVVEKIGIKTTRVKSLQGEEIVISNQELTSARVHNYKKMDARRIVFSFGVTYGTNLEKLKRIPQIVKIIIDSIEGAKTDRAHFYKYGDFALLFEVVYFVKTGDYNQYMDINQEIHFKIKEEFEKENISMAFPTQSIYLENKNS